MRDNDRQDDRRYDDLLDLPHHVSPTRRHMTASERAAQFAPFAALTGYGEAIEMTARPVDERIELDESERAALDRRLRLLQARLKERPTVILTHFVPDRFKAGGRYEVISGVVRRILPVEGVLQLEGGVELDIDDVIGIDGDIFDRLGLE